ncbi:MAG TPA: alpha/beta hydrolase-fold protein [Cyclobacteriaceae bacterium]|nr:hypothetical protein [Cyclobacteriaceae bacterium]HMV11085.1 alpha/beta hydrolase-fold protein [Cyclobacteriaceae bacterium]HMV88914.1 alpha/beta hydrolase-fold protein [Cyclobacteriaceae bacterium]HMX01125.1 alpha/beta hydrolase-fold protein [Cyclobacteriaceae bacterium]HMY91927.1 alpha/beta hydrolase-fold protein [Cyclobacteriaceae bacterium]
MLVTTALKRLKKYLFSCVFLSCLLCYSFAQNDEPVLNIDERIVIESVILNEQRTIWISLPSGYHAGTDNKRYPVLYLLDGQDHFQLAKLILNCLKEKTNEPCAFSEMILVAIWSKNRFRDFTPSPSQIGLDGKTKEHLKISGGGDNFLKFMSSELIPCIDSAYRTSKSRFFAGHSLGGLLVMYALQTCPALFDAYIAIDPSLWWDDHLLVRQAEVYYSLARLEGKYLFLAQANTRSSKKAANDHYKSIRRMKHLFDKKTRSGLDWTYQFYEHDNHNSVVSVAVNDALRLILKKNFSDKSK